MSGGVLGVVEVQRYEFQVFKADFFAILLPVSLRAIWDVLFLITISYKIHKLIITKVLAHLLGFETDELDDPELANVC